MKQSKYRRSYALLLIIIIGIVPKRTYTAEIDRYTIAVEKIATMSTAVTSLVTIFLLAKAAGLCKDILLFFLDLRQKYSQKSILTNQIVRVPFESYINPPDEVEQLVEMLKNPDGPHKSLGITLPTGILFTGDPGTGKTFLAQAIAGALPDIPFFCYTSIDLIGEYTGQTGPKVRGIYSLARIAAQDTKGKIAIIFIDEIDALGARSTNQNSSYTDEAITTLLTEIDGAKSKNGVRIITLTATN